MANAEKGEDGWQVKYGWSSFLPRPPPSMVSFLLGDERVDKIEMSKVSNKHSVSFGRQAQASCFEQ